MPRKTAAPQDLHHDNSAGALVVKTGANVARALVSGRGPGAYAVLDLHVLGCSLGKIVCLSTRCSPRHVFVKKLHE